MTDTTLDARLRQTFLREQRNGLRLALWGRVAVVVVIGIWIAVSRPPPLLYYTISGVAASAFWVCFSSRRFIGGRTVFG